MFEPIDKLGDCTQHYFDAKDYVRQAFAMGLYWGRIPTFEGLQRAYAYEVRQLVGDDENFSGMFGEFNGPEVIFKFGFISDSAVSWHAMYRAWRTDFERVFVKREGGRIQYLMKQHDSTMPEGYQTIWVLLDISLSTCKRISKGMKTVEVEDFEVVCEDLQEPVEEEPVYPEVAGEHPGIGDFGRVPDACRHGNVPEDCLTCLQPRALMPSTPEELAAGDDEIPF